MTFQLSPAKKEQVPLLIGLSGPSGSGKTWSAFELAEGIKSVHGGPIVHIDTENRRGLHYANDFDFLHMPFEPPFRSSRYSEAIKEAEKVHPSVIIIDSMSHEHEGEGGLNDYHAEMVQQMIDRAKSNGNRDADWVLENKFKMQAWQKPKQERGRLRSDLTRSGASIIMCFRTKETAKPQANDKGKMEIIDMGFTPIAGDEFVYEATVSMLLMPSSQGVPTWKSTKPGEMKAIKRPAWSECILKNGQQITREHGRLLAEWARGDEVDIDELLMAAQAEAAKGRDAITKHISSLPQGEQLALSKFREQLWTDAKKADAAAALADAENQPA